MTPCGPVVLGGPVVVRDHQAGSGGPVVLLPFRRTTTTTGLSCRGAEINNFSGRRTTQPASSEVQHEQSFAAVRSAGEPSAA
jgi:hypothetical protein